MPVLLDHRHREPERTFGGFTYPFLRDHLPQLIADMEMAVNRVVKIVADLKNFSRQSNIAEKTLLNINTAVHNALRLCQSTLGKAGIGIRLDLAEKLPDIEGNLQNIEQIVLNILINAAQAIEHPHGDITIQTGFNVKDGRVQLQISDNGRGISPAIADRIFLPFVTDKQAQGGTGLGLSVSYSLVKAHGGEIAFENRPSGGTTFTVWLPTVLNRKAAKILVVDDDRMVRKILMKALAIPRSYLSGGGRQRDRGFDPARNVSAGPSDSGCVDAGDGRCGGMPTHPGGAGVGRHEGHHYDRVSQPLQNR